MAATTLPLILLPPSEGKASGGTGAPWAPGTMEIDLDDRRSDVTAALTRAMRGSIPAGCYRTMNVPVIVVGWTSHRKKYVPASSAGTS